MAQAEADERQARGWDEFAPLYDEHHERLYRVALLLCRGSSAEAEDAVAETFIKVYRRWVDGDIENFFGYARRSLVTHVIGQHRHRQVADSYLSRHGQEGPAPVDVETSVTEGAATFDLLAALPLRQRTAIVLRYYEDLSYAQIAELMGVSVGTVKAQVSAGLGRMRAMMAEETA